VRESILEHFSPYAGTHAPSGRGEGASLEAW